MRRWVAGGILMSLCSGVTGRLAAQGSSVLSQAIQSYQNLDFQTAADLLRGLLDRPSIPVEQQEQALGYLGASEFFLGHRDAAVSVFRDKVTLMPREPLDPLVFPPEVQRVFEEARSSVKLVDVEIPREADIRGKEPIPIRLFASSYHDIAVGLAGKSGHVVRWLYNGPIADSIDLTWDGRDASQAVVPPGGYTLRIASRSSGRTVRTLEIPVTVTRQRSDTVALPRPPDASQLLPERGRRGLVQSAARGLAIAVAVLALPTIAGADSIAAGAPLLVGAAIGIAGAAELVLHPSGKPIPSNIAYNRQLREAYQRRLDEAREENRRRRADLGMVVRTGEPVIREGADQ